MTVDLHARDDAIVATVMNRSGSHFAQGVVRKIVVDCVQQFDGAPIQAFVPVLVVKKTTDALLLLYPSGFDHVQTAPTAGRLDLDLIERPGRIDHTHVLGEDADAFGRWPASAPDSCGDVGERDQVRPIACA